MAVRTTALALLCGVCVVLATESTLLPECSVAVCAGNLARCVYRGQVTSCGLCAVGRECGCDGKQVFVCSVPSLPTISPTLTPNNTPRSELSSAVEATRQCASLRTDATARYTFPAVFVLPAAFVRVALADGETCCSSSDACPSPTVVPDTPCERRRTARDCVAVDDRCRWEQGITCAAGFSVGFCVERDTACTRDIKCLVNTATGLAVQWGGCAPREDVWERADLERCACYCVHDGRRYPTGAGRAADDGCNKCICHNREWRCTDYRCDLEPCVCSEIPTRAPEPCPGLSDTLAGSIAAFSADIPTECHRTAAGECVLRRRPCPNIPQPGPIRPNVTTVAPTCTCAIPPAAQALWKECPDGTRSGPQCRAVEENRCVLVNEPCDCDCDREELARNPLRPCPGAPGHFYGLRPACVHNRVRNTCGWARQECPVATPRKIVFVVRAVFVDGQRVPCDLLIERLVAAGYARERITVEDGERNGERVCVITITLETAATDDSDAATEANVSAALSTDPAFVAADIAVEPQQDDAPASAAGAVQIGTTLASFAVAAIAAATL